MNPKVEMDLLKKFIRFLSKEKVTFRDLGGDGVLVDLSEDLLRDFRGMRVPPRVWLNPRRGPTWSQANPLGARVGVGPLSAEDRAMFTIPREVVATTEDKVLTTGHEFTHLQRGHVPRIFSDYFLAQTLGTRPGRVFSRTRGEMEADLGSARGYRDAGFGKLPENSLNRWVIRPESRSSDIYRYREKILKKMGVLSLLFGALPALSPQDEGEEGEGVEGEA